MHSYANYKASIIESIDKIPQHWNYNRFKYIFKFGKGLNITKENLTDEGIPCLNYGEVHSKYGFEVDPEIHPLKCVSDKYLKRSKSSLLNIGDFVFADTSEDIEGSGNFTYLNSTELVFAGYHTVIARPKELVNSRFLAYLIDSIAFRTQIRKKVKGVKVYSITQAILRDTLLWFPPKIEQTLITNFLDQKTEKIDDTITTKEKQISLLNERKKILIQNSVIRGLDPDVPIQDSGVDWIGDIPAHWSVTKLKFIFQEINERTTTGTEVLFSLRMKKGLVPHNDVSDKHIPAENLIDYKIVEEGQFVMNRMRASIGIFGIAYARGLVSPDYAIFKSTKGIHKEFYLMLFKSTILGTQFRLNSKGLGTGSSGFMRLYTENFGGIKVPLPPEQEQEQIMEFIEVESEKIEKAISLQEQQLDKLKEYKATLINSAVTGKIRVLGVEDISAEVKETECTP